MLSTHVPRPGLRRAVGLLVTTVLTAALLPFALAGPASTQAPAPIAAAACADGDRPVKIRIALSRVWLSLPQVS